MPAEPETVFPIWLSYRTVIQRFRGKLNIFGLKDGSVGKVTWYQVWGPTLALQNPHRGGRSDFHKLSSNLYLCTVGMCAHQHAYLVVKEKTAFYKHVHTPTSHRIIFSDYVSYQATMSLDNPSYYLTFSPNPWFLPFRWEVLLLFFFLFSNFFRTSC